MAHPQSMKHGSSQYDDADTHHAVLPPNGIQAALGADGRNRPISCKQKPQRRNDPLEDRHARLERQRWFQVKDYITTGLSGSSLACGPCRGKCLASSRDTISMP